MIQTVFLSCAVFLVYLLLIPTSPGMMFTDPDTLWHIASGDLIRASGALPEHDPWSFTAGNEQWYNISWLWDILASYVYQQGGWHGITAMNSLIIATTVALIFAACFLRTRDSVSSFIAVMITTLTILNCSVRPYQITILFIAVLMLLLAQISRRLIAPAWLLILPAFMIVWVNVHGGFLMAFLLLGIAGLDVMMKKDWRLFRWYFFTGVASLFACLINPYGIFVLTGALRTITTNAQSFIIEWQPLSFSIFFLPTQAYVVLFLITVMMQRLPIARSEKWIAYTWLVLSISAIRNFGIFAVVSPPLLAIALQQIFTSRQQAPRPVSPAVQNVYAASIRMSESRSGACGIFVLTIATCLWIFTPHAARTFQTDSFNPSAGLTEDIDYVKTHYPNLRLLSDYSLGGPLIFYARGTIPVFIDGRASTVYPVSTINDYIAFLNASKGWGDMVDRYKLQGALLPSSELITLDRLAARKGWYVAYKGKKITVLLRDK